MKDPDDTQPMEAPFRIAFRVEGRFINAYFAAPTTMHDAQLLGCILKNICDEDRAIWERFKELMREAMTSVMKAAIGIEPVGFGEEPAPESERSGSA